MELLWWASLTLVYAHNHHRRNVDNPVSVGSCMEREVRFMTAITPTYGHAYQSLCLVERPIAIPHQQFRSPAVRVKYPHLPNSRTTTRQKRMISRVGRSVPLEELACLMVKPWLAGVMLLVHLMEEFTSCSAQLLQFRQTSHMQVLVHTSVLEALSFLGPCGPVARGSRSCIFYDSKHPARVCLDTIQARTNIQLGLPCQRLLLRVQLTLRFTMQHVYRHAQNIGKECADHAAAPGSFGLVSSQNTQTRWTLPSFDSNYVFATCQNLDDVLQKLRDIRTARASASQRHL